ncbi:DUF4365 domain-containing protein [Methylosinus sp. H3A]|uniref:DUF4365 domain-containing protein n=1 Tax=Methylosinus sp. H3A TaxID=2785786 RepID=UPI0018C1DD72|nr:DUF4365 domain-containing protein [Methylosinus sp. H3A]MBG0808099.1 DUF4365 domain-containing protein [Methylosinus sp. H3A]
MARIDSTISERTGVNAVEAIFLRRLKWLFREQPVSDFGIDAQAEVTVDGEPTGKLIALQIKSGQSFFSRKCPEGFIYRGEMRHLDYWENHSLPVFLILHNPDDGTTLWQKIDRRICKLSKRGWSVLVPNENVLDEKAQYHLAHGLVNDDESKRRFAFSVDASFMERFKDETVTMIWEDWINKGLGLRNPTFKFPNGETMRFESWYPTHDVFEAMSCIYPWLQYEYAEEISEESGEVEFHVLDVELRPAAKGFLEAEAFFREGINESPPEPLGREDDDFDDAWSQGEYSELAETLWNDKDDPI